MNQLERGDLCLILSLLPTGHVSLGRNPPSVNFLTGKKKRVNHRAAEASLSSNPVVCMR